MKCARFIYVLLITAVLHALSPTGVAAAKPSVAGGVLEFSLTDLAGESVSHDDERFEGKVVLVTLWGTWCPPCITEIPTFNDLQARLGSEGLVVVAIAFERGGNTQQRRAKLKKFVKKLEIEYLVVDGGLTRDAARALPTLRDVKGLPVEILIDREGRVRETRHGYGYSKSWAQKLEAELRTMLEHSATE